MTGKYQSEYHDLFTIDEIDVDRWCDRVGSHFDIVDRTGTNLGFGFSVCTACDFGADTAGQSQDAEGMKMNCAEGNGNAVSVTGIRENQLEFI